MSDAVDRRSGRYAAELQEWLLLDGNRFVVAAVVLAGAFAALAAVAWGNLLSIDDPTPFYYVFSGLIGGNLTLVTVVVSINQLVVSRQLMSAGEVRDHMREAIEFREDVEDVADGPVAPVEPDAFLGTLVSAALRELDRIDDARAAASGDLAADLDDLVMPLRRHLDYVNALLERSGTDVFAALSTILDANYAAELRDAERVSIGYDLDADAADAVDDLRELLRHLNVARQFFKTVYMQEELSYLSRVLVYVGVPAVFAAILSLVAIAVETGPGIPWWVTDVVFPVGVTVGLAPLAVLSAFVLRVATVTEQTAATTPFIRL